MLTEDIIKVIPDLPEEDLKLIRKECGIRMKEIRDKEAEEDPYVYVIKWLNPHTGWYRHLTWNLGGGFMWDNDLTHSALRLFNKREGEQYLEVFRISYGGRYKEAYLEPVSKDSGILDVPKPELYLNRRS